jgi:hypothetical protein
MKGRFFTKKEWRELKAKHADEVSDAYARGRRDVGRAVEAPNILATACWMALSRPAEALSMVSSPIVSFATASVGQIGYTIKDDNCGQHTQVELYHKELLPEA